MSFSDDERDKELFRTIVEANGYIKKYLANVERSEFLIDSKTQDAVTMRLQQILECATKLSSKKAELKIDWPSMVAMRNKISHSYIDIDPSIIWEVVSEFEEFRKLISWAGKNV